ncbi:MAG TPA: tetratricopeptide repeat protein [Bryobacteraceae bacterium]|nr:tetratricopeptide repeat protein [Bryobacteraceae bacterium]
MPPIGRLVAAFLLSVNSTTLGQQLLPEASGKSVERLIDLNQLDAAQIQLEARKQIEGNTPRVTFLDAMILHRRGKYLASAEKLAGVESALRRDPDFLKLAGLNLIGLELLEPAGPYFDRAAELAPRDGMAHYYVGLWRLKTREFVGAEAALRRSLELLPEHSDTYLMLGLTLEQQAKTEAALAAYAKAAEKAKNRGFSSEAPHLYAGRLLLILNRAEESIPHLNEALKVSPKCFEVLFALGKAHETLGQLKEAEAAYRKSVELSPQDDRAPYRLMQLLHKQGRTEEARRIREGLRVRAK